jgi:hypothetical protein
MIGRSHSPRYNSIWPSRGCNALGLPTAKLSFEHLPAVGRVSVSSPAVMKSLAKFNEGKPYSDLIKPFNFLLTCHIEQLGHPPGVDPEHFHLIAPYSIDPKEWLKADWINQYDPNPGKTYRIITAGPHGHRRTALVKTYGDVLDEYEYHPESKCADADGHPCGKQTVGLLGRRQIRVDQIRYIGKESNRLEDVDSGLVHAAQNVYTEYPDPRRDEWQTKIIPALQKIPAPLVAGQTGLPERTLREAISGRSTPRLKTQMILTTFVHKLGAI